MTKLYILFTQHLYDNGKFIYRLSLWNSNIFVYSNMPYTVLSRNLAHVYDCRL